MYECNECGAEFDEFDLIFRRENLDGERGWERQTASCCPYCGSDNIERTRKDEDAEDFDARHEPRGVA